MFKHYDSVLSTLGEPITGVVITVTTYPGGVPVTLYDDDEITLLDPCVTNSEGEYYFNVNAGTYTIVHTYNGVVIQTIPKVTIGYPTSVGAVSSVNAQTGAVSLNGGYLGVKGADIASGASVDLSTATGDWVDVTGSGGPIVSFGTVAAGVERLIRFTGTPTLTHNATSLILPTSANIVVAAGDFARFRSLGSGNWVCVGYMRASGAALTGSGGGGSSKYRRVFKPRDNEPPTTNFATLDTRNAHPVLDFDTTTQETAIFSDVISAAYGGGDITVTVIAALTSATTGTLGWDVTFERVGTAQDIDADGFATAQTITATTVPGTSGFLMATSVSITAGAAGTDSLAAGEAYRLRIRRDVANDNAAGDAELWAVVVSEN